MKIVKENIQSTLDQLREGIVEWRRLNNGKRNASVPTDHREKIRSLSGLIENQEIAAAIGLHPVTISKIMKEGSEKPAGQKHSKETLPKVITLAPLHMTAPKFSGDQKAELESPQGWKLKVSGTFDLTTIIKVMMEVRV